MNEPKNTPVVMVRKEGTEHFTLTRREDLTEDDTFETSIKSDTWPGGYLDQYVRHKEEELNEIMEDKDED